MSQRCWAFEWRLRVRDLNDLAKMDPGSNGVSARRVMEGETAAAPSRCKAAARSYPRADRLPPGFAGRVGRLAGGFDVRCLEPTDAPLPASPPVSSSSRAPDAYRRR